MTDYNDLAEAIEEYGHDEDGNPNEEFEDNGYESGWDYITEEGYGGKPVVMNLLGKDVSIKVVESKQQSEESYLILEIDGTLYRKDGWYASHYGSEWDGSFYPVKPVEKTITVWKRA